ncbi:hypothetical protein G6M89_21940 [Natronolimnobius sp. AArcel1]|nr:hypothetical protein [Natronolimnobius sp. AArcel1]NGM71610.1 hypothetical protein [Natronolimnobius sp. AArcel1]
MKHMPFNEVEVTVDAVMNCWMALERDWQSVLVGAIIVVLVGGLELPIPW